MYVARLNGQRFVGSWIEMRASMRSLVSTQILSILIYRDSQASPSLDFL